MSNVQRKRRPGRPRKQSPISDRDPKISNNKAPSIRRFTKKAMYEQILKVQKVLVLAKEKVKLLEQTKGSKRDLLYAQDEVVSSLNRREELVESFKTQKHVSNRAINEMLDKASDLYPEEESSTDGEYNLEEESHSSSESSEESQDEQESDESNDEDDSANTTTISNESKNVSNKPPIIIDMENSSEDNTHTSNPPNSIQNDINEALQTLTPSEKVSLMIKKAQLRNRTKNRTKTSTTPTLTLPKETSTNKSPIQTSKNVTTNKKNMTDSSSQLSNKQRNDMEDQSDTDDESETSISCESKKREKINNRSHIKKTQQTITNIRKHQTLLTLKLKVNKTNLPVKELILKATNWFRYLQTMDPNAVLYQYYSEDTKNAITTSKKIPSEIEKFKKYFSGANPLNKEGHAWCQIWIGHDEPMSNIKTNMKSWCSDKDTYMYVKRLQHKDTVREYFLLWSSEKMDVQRLHEATCDALMKYTMHLPSFAFIWSVIRKDRGGYSTKEAHSDKGKQYVRALHIEVPRVNKQKTYNLLSKVFSSKSTLKILGRDLRMVPTLRKEQPGYVRTKINHLIEKQEKYGYTLETTYCYDLGDIDYINSNLDMSMRDMIMNLHTIRTFDKNNKTIPIFTSIDYTEWPEPCYILTYPKHLAQEALDYMASLPSFLVWCYGENVLDMINTEAIRKAQEAPWDPDEMRAITPESLELDAITAEAEKNIPWISHDQVVIPNISDVSTNDFLFKRAKDADSISTFQSRKSNREEEEEDDGTRITKRAKKVNEILRNDQISQDTTNNTTSNNDTNNCAIVSPAGSKRTPNASANDLLSREAEDHANFPPGHENDPGAVR